MCRRFSLKKKTETDECPSVLRILHHEDAVSDSSLLGSILKCDSTGLGSTALSEALSQKISAPNRLLSTSRSLATIVVGFPELDLSATEVYSWKRDHGIASKSSAAVIMPDIGQVQHNALFNYGVKYNCMRKIGYNKELMFSDN